MTCPPFCDRCGGNLGHPANGDWVCAKCQAAELRDEGKALYRNGEREAAERLFQEADTLEGRKA